MRKPTGGFPIRQGLLKIRRRSIFKNDNLFEIVKLNITTRQAAEALQICQKDFMQEDTQAGMIYAFLEDYTGDRVCSKQLYAEALGNLNLPAEWETRAICEIMTAGIVNGEIKGWTAHKAAKRYPKYGVQKGWERVTAAKVEADGFVELTDEEAQQMGFPF